MFIWAEINSNLAVSNVADRIKLQGAVQNEKLLSTEGIRKKEVVLCEKPGSFLQGYFPLRDGRGLIRQFT